MFSSTVVTIARFGWLALFLRRLVDIKIVAETLQDNNFLWSVNLEDIAMTMDTIIVGDVVFVWHKNVCDGVRVKPDGSKVLEICFLVHFKGSSIGMDK